MLQTSEVSRVLVRTLENGTRCVLEPIPGCPVVGLLLCFNRGSRHEAAPESGLTHFCEHLLFKGTSSSDWQHLARRFNLLGGHANASTSLDGIQLENRVVPGDLEAALALMAEMALDSSFPAVEVERERGVILEEIAEYEDSPSDRCSESFTTALFGDHPLGRPVIGARETVGSFTAEGAREFWRDIATAPNVVVSIAGGFDAEEAYGVCARLLAGVPANGNHARGVVPHKARPGFEFYASEDLEQAQFCFGVEGLPRRDPDRFALYLLDTILGAGMGSRLFNEVRERRGLAYTIGSSLYLGPDAGTFTVGGSTSAETLDEVLAVSREVIEALVTEGPTDEEVETAKAQLARSIVLHSERASERAALNAGRELVGDEHVSPAEALRRVHAPTREEVRTVARRLWSDSVPALSVVGPLSPEAGRRAGRRLGIEAPLNGA